MSIGQRISELRKRNAYSQEYVAEKLGVSRQAVSKWETDTSAPDTYNLIALAELFEVSVEYLATGKLPDQPREGLQPQEEDAKSNRLTAQKIVGFILFGAGLIAFLLGFFLSELLIILSVYLLTGGILCLTVHRKLWFVAMWVYLGFTGLLITVLTAQNLFLIFDPSVYRNGFGLSVGILMSYAFWIWLMVAIAITVTMTVKKHKTKTK